MANEFEKMNDGELEQVAGGKAKLEPVGNGTKTKVTGLKSGYLALRKEPGYDASNEIGQLYNGDEVDIIGGVVYVDKDFNKNGSTPYINVYSKRLKKSGWVNATFITSY